MSSEHLLPIGEKKLIKILSLTRLACSFPSKQLHLFPLSFCIHLRKHSLEMKPIRVLLHVISASSRSLFSPGACFVRQNQNRKNTKTKLAQRVSLNAITNDLWPGPGHTATSLITRSLVLLSSITSPTISRVPLPAFIWRITSGPTSTTTSPLVLFMSLACSSSTNYLSLLSFTSLFSQLLLSPLHLIRKLIFFFSFTFLPIQDGPRLTLKCCSLLSAAQCRSNLWHGHIGNLMLGKLLFFPPTMCYSCKWAVLSKLVWWSTTMGVLAVWLTLLDFNLALHCTR